MALLDFRGAPHGGQQRHLPEWQSQPRITPTTIIDHSIVGSAEGAWQMFKDRSSLESHFIVRGRRSGTSDGWIWQLMDTDRQGDANLQANGYALSIETEDDGDPDHQPWTNAQIESLAWLHDELRRVHPTIPRRQSRSCGDPGGLGYHTLHGAPSCWTPVSKSCPGTVRKGQWRALLLPAFLAGTVGPDTTPEEPDMTPDQAEQLKKIHDVLFNAHARQNNPIDNLYGNALRTHDALVVPGTTSAEQAFNLLFARVRNIEKTVTELAAELGTSPEPPLPEPPA